MAEHPELTLNGEKSDGNLFLSSKELQDRIAVKYPAPSYATLYEVRDGTGFMTAGREADAMVFGTWPSRGLQILGFEIKVHRSDWLRELKKPEKAEGFAQFCDEWWLVTCGDVARIEEIPPPWGWYIGTEKGLKVLKQPKPIKPKEISRLLLMSIMRNVTKHYVPRSHMEDLAKVEAENIMKRRRDENEFIVKEAKKLKETLAQFKAESGIDLLNDWHFPAAQVGAVVKAVMDENLPRHIEAVKEAAEMAGKLLKTIKALPMVRAAGIDKA